MECFASMHVIQAKKELYRPDIGLYRAKYRLYRTVSGVSVSYPILKTAKTSYRDIRYCEKYRMMYSPTGEQTLSASVTLLQHRRTLRQHNASGHLVYTFRFPPMYWRASLAGTGQFYNTHTFRVTDSTQEATGDWRPSGMF
jgi:hypothetical protein